MTDEQRIALLEATLREILRINRTADEDNHSMGFETALEGRLLAEWKSIRRKAERLLARS